jgi:hypothetical protein
MEMTPLSINNIKSIAENIEKSDYDCNRQLRDLNGDIETQVIDENYKKLIIRNMSGNVRAIVIDCKSDRIKAISFNGIIEISPKKLWEIYKTYREAYSIRDDLYFYFFNEDKKQGNYVLSFFEPTHRAVNISKNDEYLSNVMLSWD